MGNMNPEPRGRSRRDPQYETEGTTKENTTQKMCPIAQPFSKNC